MFPKPANAKRNPASSFKNTQTINYFRDQLSKTRKCKKIRDWFLKTRE
jgi:hypothetical protein